MLANRTKPYARLLKAKLVHSLTHLMEDFMNSLLSLEIMLIYLIGS